MILNILQAKHKLKVSYQKLFKKLTRHCWKSISSRYRSLILTTQKQWTSKQAPTRSQAKITRTYSKKSQILEWNYLRQKVIRMEQLRQILNSKWLITHTLYRFHWQARNIPAIANTLWKRRTWEESHQAKAMEEGHQVVLQARMDRPLKAWKILSDHYNTNPKEN